MRSGIYPGVFDPSDLGGMKLLYHHYYTCIDFHRLASR